MRPDPAPDTVRAAAEARPASAARGVRCLAAVPGLVLALFLVPPLQATRMLALAIERLTADASLVVHARVTDVEVARDRAGRIFTRAGFEVREVWKGRLAGTRCEVVAGGGVLGERAVTVAGQASYAVGDEVVAFLVRNPAGELVTVGLAQGRFEVRVDPASGQRHVSNGFHGTNPSAGEGAPAPGAVRAPLQKTLRLEELRSRVREVAR